MLNIKNAGKLVKNKEKLSDAEKLGLIELALSAQELLRALGGKVDFSKVECGKTLLHAVDNHLKSIGANGNESERKAKGVYFDKRYWRAYSLKDKKKYEQYHTYECAWHRRKEFEQGMKLNKENKKGGKTK